MTVLKSPIVDTDDLWKVFRLATLLRLPFTLMKRPFLEMTSLARGSDRPFTPRIYFSLRDFRKSILSWETIPRSPHGDEFAGTKRSEVLYHFLDAANIRGISGEDPVTDGVPIDKKKFSIILYVDRIYQEIEKRTKT